MINHNKITNCNMKTTLIVLMMALVSRWLILMMYDSMSPGLQAVNAMDLTSAHVKSSSAWCWITVPLSPKHRSKLTSKPRSKRAQSTKQTVRLVEGCAGAATGSYIMKLVPKPWSSIQRAVGSRQ